MTSREQIAGFEEVSLELDVELDRKTMTIEELLNLEAGSVIRMSRSAGENIDIVVGGVLIASGEIVIIEDAMGVRITDYKIEE